MLAAQEQPTLGMKSACNSIFWKGDIWVQLREPYSPYPTWWYSANEMPDGQALIVAARP